MHVHVKVINRAFRVGCSTGTESDPCLMALSLETAYSRAHSDGLELIGGPGHTLIFQFNVDLECDLIEHVGKTYVQEIYTTAAIWCTMFKTQLGWNDFTNWKSNKRKWTKAKSQKYFQTFTFQF